MSWKSKPDKPLDSTKNFLWVGLLQCTPEFFCRNDAHSFWWMDTPSFLLNIFDSCLPWKCISSTFFFLFFPSDSGSKRPRLEQIPAANLDADDPLDDEDVCNFSWYSIHPFTPTYSWLSLSRTRLSRITAYLEVKVWSLPKHEDLTTGKKYCGKEEKLLLRSNFSSFPQYFQYISNFRSQITHIFVKCG